MRLNVALLNDSFPPMIDGVANATFNYACNIQKHHGNVTVITPSYPGVVDDYDFPVYRYNSLRLPKKIGYRAGNPFSPRAVVRLRQRKFDIIHSHCPFASSVLARMITYLRFHNIPVVFTYHTKFDIDIEKRAGIAFLKSAARKMVLLNLNMADEVWAVSEGAVSSMRALGYTGDYRVMPNGTDFEKGLASPAEISEVRLSCGLSDSVPTLLFVGRMMWYKNIQIIIDGLRILKEKNISFKMIFVGDGVDMPEIKAYTNERGLSDSICFAGAIADREKVRAYFSCADLFLFPSTYDTSGLVVKEAAACSCPSLLVSGSCASEGVEHLNTGYLCEENPVSFAEVLINALSDMNGLKQIGENAAEHIYLSWEDSVSKAYERYEELASLGRKEYR